MVEGTVRAQSGLPLEGVEVQFVAGGGGTSVSVFTDTEGRFGLVVGQDNPGTLTFSLSGYGEEAATIPALGPGVRHEASVTLGARFTLDALTVISRLERPLLNTDDAETGGAIEAEELRGLPSDARDPLTLAFTIPGVSQGTGFFGDAPPLTVNGGNTLYTQYLVDGLDNNEGFLGGPRVALPLSALSRLEVSANSYRPGVGRSPNGVVNLMTRSGGPEWEYDLFVTSRPGSELDASPKFAPAGVDPDGFQRMQLGGSAGGALVPGKVFVFGAMEYTDEREDRIGSTARTAFLGTELRETWKGFARLDYGWGPTHTTTAQVAISDVSREGQGGGAIVPEADITTRRRGTLTNVTHRSALRGGEASNTLSAQLGTFRWYFPPSISDLTTPQVEILGLDGSTEAVVGSSNFVFDESELQVQLKEVFETRLGDRHTLGFGADVVRSSFELTAASTNPVGKYVVRNDGRITSAGPFLSINDIPQDIEVISYTIDANQQQVDLTQTLWGAFIEDRWRVSPSLTLLAGVRWDYDDITSRGDSDADLNNFQPRISANWLVDGATVARGGWGMYAGKFPYAVYSDAVQFGPDGNAVVVFDGGAFAPPAFLDGPSAADIAALQDGLPPREVRALFARGLEQPMSRQTTLGLQRQIGEDWGVSIDGVWIETRNLPRSWDLNAIEGALAAGDTVARGTDFGDPLRPSDPSVTGVRRLTTTDSGGEGRYLGLYTTLRHRFSEELLLEANWVWSRSENDTEDINFNATVGNDFSREWADAVNDRRHQISARATWRVSEAVTLGGVADWQTGIPINRIANRLDLDGSGGIFGEGFVGNFDRYPGVARNAERLPSAFLFNGSVGYRVEVAGSGVDLRAEVFNLLNATNYSGFANGIPGGGPRTQVGRIGDPITYTTAAPPRQFQLTARWVR